MILNESGRMELQNNVILLSNYAADYEGNFIRSLNCLCSNIKGEKILVLPPKAKEKKWTKREYNFKIIYNDFSLGSMNSIAERFLLEYGPNAIIYAHFINDFLLLPFLHRFTTVIFHYHMAVDKPKNVKGKIKSAIRRCINSRGVFKKLVLIGVSEPVAESLKQRYTNSRIVCIPNCIDFSRYKDVRRENIKENRRVKILIFGTHFYRKGVDLAINAIKKVRQSHVNASITVPVHDLDDCRQKIQNILGEIPEWINIIPVQEDVAELYTSADIFLSPSRSEAFGYAVLESDYCGCSVIASDVPGQNSLMDVPGIEWVPPENVNALADKILSIAERNSHDEVKHRIIQKYLEMNYGIDQWVDKEINFLYQLSTLFKAQV